MSIARCLSAAVCLAALAGALSAAEPPVELRGAWLWGRTCRDAASADRMLDRAGRMHLNALYVLTFYNGGTVYHRTDLAATNGTVAEGFDPLGHLVAEGRRRGIEVHAWFVNGPIRNLDRAKVLRDHPDFQAVNLAGRKVDWYDLCNPGVRDWQAKLMADVAGRYAVRSVHFDYIRFGNSSMCGSPAARRAAAEAGIDADLLTFPRLPAVGDFKGNPLAEPTTAEVLAEFDGNVPAVAVNPLGKGRVVLLNWHADQGTPAAVDAAVARALRLLGAQKSLHVHLLRSKVNAVKYGYRGCEVAARWLRGLGARLKLVGDDGLADLPAGAVVVLPKHYLMPADQAEALVAHVSAGGGALFLDGPVYAMKHEPARKLLGFARSGKYFSGERVLRASEANGRWKLVPTGGPEIDTAAVARTRRAWKAWCKEQVTKLVVEAGRTVKQRRDECLITAAVFQSPEAADGVCQDWPRWLREGLVDYVVPMSYVPTAKELARRFAWYKQIDPDLARIIPAVGVTKIDAKLSPADRAARIAEQVAVCRDQGSRGVVLFNLESLRDETAAILGREVFPGKAVPYRPDR